MNALNTVWLMCEEMERDWLGVAIEYMEGRNGHKDRAAAATAILEENGVTQDPANPAHFFVQSEEDAPFTVYEVHIGDPPECTCEDHVERHVVFCKHVCAARRVYYLQRAWERESGRTVYRIDRKRKTTIHYDSPEFNDAVASAWGTP